MPVVKQPVKKVRPRTAITHTQDVDSSKTQPAVPRHNLSYVPEKHVADNYIGRQIGGHQDMEVFDYAFNHALNVLLSGPTGPGKTTALMAYAASQGKRFYSVACNIGLDPSQLFGKLVPDGKGGWVWVDGGVTEIVREGGVLIFNEVNFMPERISTVTFSLLDNRRLITLLDHRGEVIRAHRPPDSRTGVACWCDLDADECRKRWVLVAADMNPDYAGTRPLNQAFKNRFPIQLDWDYDSNVESKLVKSGTLLTMAQNIRQNSIVETPVPTNLLVEFEHMAKDLGLGFAIENFIQHFLPEEKEAIRTAFQHQMEDLEDDYKPAEPTPWDEFGELNGWMEDDDDASEEDDDGDEEF